MMARFVLSLLFLSIFLMGADVVVKHCRFAAVEGDSTSAGANDVAGPLADNHNGVNFNPGSPVANAGWTSALIWADSPLLRLTTNDMTVGGTTTGQHLYEFSCKQANGNWRPEPCTAPGAGGDAECAAACGASCVGATCENPTINYHAGRRGLQTEPFTYAFIGSAVNECGREGVTVAEVIDRLRELFNVNLNHVKLRPHAGGPRITYWKNECWVNRLDDAGAAQTCLDLWESHCTSCGNTIEDLVANEFSTTVSLNTDVYDFFVTRQTQLYNDFHCHSNELAQRLRVVMLAEAAGVAIVDQEPGVMNLSVGNIQTDRADVTLDSAVTDPDGDTLNCFIYVADAATDHGLMVSRDRLWQAQKVCQALGADPCTDCVPPLDGNTNADCGVNGNTRNAEAPLYVADVSDPVGIDELPDAFPVACSGGTVTVPGLSSATDYDAFGVAVPDLVPGGLDGLRLNASWPLTRFTTN